MNDRGHKNDSSASDDDATDKRTLEEIEEDEVVANGNSEADAPSPDEGSGRSDDDDAGEVM